MITNHLRSGFRVALAGAALLVAAPARAATIDLSQATVADIQAAFAAGTLTSEQLVRMSLARIEAYDDKGPNLNAIIVVNPKAIETAKALDAERKAKGPRSPLHGVPIIAKDIFNTTDMPTTAGSVFLAGSIPPKDSFMITKLREAGAVILAKANTSEFASSGRSNGFSSLGGQTRNPHDPKRGPAGSSGGSGAAVAAWYAPIALGTDTGGSIRGPAAANGIAGIKPTRGLLSRAGIVPLALSFDTGGPMAKSVYDCAVALGIMTGIDPDDPVTNKSVGLAHRDYTVFLKPDSLRGARIGVLLDYAGSDEGTKAVFKQSLETLKARGATLVDITLPEHIKNRTWATFVRNADFKANIADYLATLDPKYPKTLDDLIAAAEKFTKPTAVGVPNPARWDNFKREATGIPVTDPMYLATRDHGMAMTAAFLDGLVAAHQLDAFVYPTAGQPAQLIDRDYDAPTPPGGGGTSLANHSGFPDVIVPAGVTKDRLPVTLSFLGPAFSEPRLLGLAYDFEQATKARVLPPTTPALAGEKISL
ncbi:amidase [Opitutales bacterium ASA1]|uniref:amidase family protein n=1 Tax=Congregicoccus parvus TaxID=3081749 RepID=UPI002B29B9A6|nr:amidase [Opitutales bacterium ASA1]